mgnify:CR=1 FL=1
MATEAVEQPGSRLWDAGLWVAQVGLSALFAVTGALRAFPPLTEGSANWAIESHTWLFRLGGFGLLLVAIALVMPPLVGVGQRLVPATATFMALTMAVAAAPHFIRGAGTSAALHLLVGAVCAFVVWGRVYKVRY